MSDYHDAGAHEGCRALWLAVLHAAIKDAVYGTPKTLAAMDPLHDPVAWIGGRDFADVCSLAGVGPDYAERYARHWMRRGKMPRRHDALADLD